MTTAGIESPERGWREAERIVEVETAWRRPKGPSRFLIPAIAVVWSLFQLSVASWWTLDSLTVRSVHLLFALLIIFLGRPFLRRPRPGLDFLSDRERIPLFDYGLAILAGLAAIYVILDYTGITTRYGAPILRDVVIGLALLLLLLEGCRRSIGPALSIIAMLFCAYAFLGPHIPGAFAFRGVSLGRFIGQMTMAQEGIYGTPLYISARVVFLFVLFGAMLERAGAGRFFTQLALSLLGGFRGGPAKAAVLSSGLTGVVSGSSIANIVTTGTFTIPLMKKVGYPAKKAAAIEVAASTDGQLAPPIMGAAAFIIAEYVNVPYVEVIKAAAIPAFASYAALLWITHVEACKLGLKKVPRSELPRFFPVLAGGLHYMVPLGFLIYQLVIVRRTPEAAAFTACWVTAIIMILQRPVARWVTARRSGSRAAPADLAREMGRGIGDVTAGLASGGRNMVSVALATAGAGIIVGVVSLGLGGLITEAIAAISLGSILLMLAITAVASLIIGMGLPTTATYITMATLTAPVIVAVGATHDVLVPLMAAHLFVFYFGILADDTPPVGLAAYAAAAIAKSPPIATGIQAFTYDIRTAILPFMFIFNSDLILHGVDSWFLAGLIFATACFGNFAFVSATQGWLATRTRFYEIPFLLSVTLILMRPDLIARWLGIAHEQRYWTSLIGLSLFAGIYAWQRWRARNRTAAAPEEGQE
jgi:TRAP transporter 4TM/12TM fusion protein